MRKIKEIANLKYLFLCYIFSETKSILTSVCAYIKEGIATWIVEDNGSLRYRLLKVVGHSGFCIIEHQANYTN